MADASDPNQVVGYVFEVKDKGSAPLGKIEQAHVDVMKQVDTAMKKFPKATDTYSKSMRDAGTATEEAGEKQKKQTSKLGEATGALKKNVLGLDKLGISWSSLIKILSAVSVGAIVYGVYKFFKSTIEAALKFRREVALLNEAYAMNARETSIVRRSLRGLTGMYGKSRDEVLSMHRSMLRLNLLQGRSGKQFRALTKTTLALSAATGISVDSAAEFTDQVIRVNRLSDIGVRRLGTAIKYIADTSKMSADELVGLNKSMTPLMQKMGLLSREAREKFSIAMLSVVASLSDAGIEGNNVLGAFTKMRDRIGEGRLAATRLASVLRLSTTEELRNLIKTDPAGLMDRLAKTMANKTQPELELLARRLPDLNMGWEELGAIGKTALTNLPVDAAIAKLKELGATEKGLTEVRKKAEEAGIGYFAFQAYAAGKAATLQKALDKAAAKRQEAIARATSNLARAWEDIKIAIGDKLIKQFLPILTEALGELTTFLRGFTWQDMRGAFSEFASATVGFAKALATVDWRSLIMSLAAVAKYLALQFGAGPDVEKFAEMGFWEALKEAPLGTALGYMAQARVEKSETEEHIRKTLEGIAVKKARRALAPMELVPLVNPPDVTEEPGASRALHVKAVSPKQEALLEEGNSIQKKILSVLQGTSTGSVPGTRELSPSDIKLAYVQANR